MVLLFRLLAKKHYCFKDNKKALNSPLDSVLEVGVTKKAATTRNHAVCIVEVDIVLEFAYKDL